MLVDLQIRLGACEFRGRKVDGKESSMTQIDLNEVKRISSEIARHRFPPLPKPSPALIKDQAAIENLLKSHFSDTGLAVAQLNKLRASLQVERRKLFAEQAAERAKTLPTAETELRQAMLYRREAAQLLSVPFQPTFISLDKPFLIWELPHPELDIFVDQHVESMNNFIKINAHKHSGGDSTTFTFYFLWTNPSDFAAVANVDTSLILNGVCEVIADTGIFSGHHNYLYLSSYLLLMRWNGWGTDPVTGKSNDQTPYPFPQGTLYQSMAALDVTGGGLFGDPGIAEQEFNFQSFPFNAELIVLPAGATMLFEVSLLLQYNIEDGGDFDDVIFDFASDNFGRRILCPQVSLELLTPVSMAKAG
jgi:hypothetical protein